MAGLFILTYPPFPFSLQQRPENRKEKAGCQTKHQDTVYRLQGAKKAPLLAHHHISVTECREVDDRVVERRGKVGEFTVGKKQSGPESDLQQVPGQHDEQEHNQQRGKAEKRGLDKPLFFQN